MLACRFFVAAVFAILATPAAHAIDRIPDRDLRSYCQQYLTRPASPSATVCVAYVQGFLDSLQSLEASPLKLERDNDTVRDHAQTQREQLDAVSNQDTDTATNEPKAGANASGETTDMSDATNANYQSAATDNPDIADEPAPERAGQNETPRNQAQTRMEALVAEYGPPARAGVCLPEGLGMERAARIIARGIVYQRAGYDESVGDQATAALRSTYPCDPEE